MLQRPVICLVTDRRRLADPSPDGLLAQARDAAAAGVSLIQVRERDMPAAALVPLVRAIVGAVAGTRTLVLVNDRADVARAGSAHGIHLRADSAPVSRARAAAPAGWVIGRSVHSVEEAQAVEGEGGADYLLFGTVFPTASKIAGHPVAGIEALRKVCAAVHLPVLAIGGITTSRAHPIAAAGAAGIAAIGLFSRAGVASAGDSVPRQAVPAVRGLASLVESLRRAFDT